MMPSTTRLMVEAMLKRKKKDRVRKTARFAELGAEEKKEAERLDGLARCKRYRERQRKLRAKVKDLAEKAELGVMSSIYAKGEAVVVRWGQGDAAGRIRMPGQIKGWVIGYGKVISDGRLRVHVTGKGGWLLLGVHPDQVSHDKEEHLLEVERSGERKERKLRRMAKSGVLSV